MTWSVRAEAVEKRFGGVRALAGVTFDAREGETVGLIGPNGSGKTTLVNVCTGLYRPDGGRVEVGGADLGQRGEVVTRFARAGVARTFQHADVFEDLTVLENVLLGAERRAPASSVAVLLGLPSGRRAARAAADGARECLRVVGLEDAADEEASVLPQGLQHLLELARALATGPRVLFLDEPAAGLNDSETAQLAGVVRGIGEMGVGIVLVEHNVEFVLGLCERVTVLNFGGVIAEAEPTAIAADPAVIDAYLGTPANTGAGDGA